MPSRRYTLDVTTQPAYDLPKIEIDVSRNRVRALEKTMALRRRIIAALLCVTILCFISASPGRTAAAQNTSAGETFRARLSPVPIDVTMMSTVAGPGSITATLSGKQRSITGTFEGLR